MRAKVKIFNFKSAIICLVLCFGESVNTIKAQQDPMFTQYMFNTLSVNPAYAGSRDMLSILFLVRQQWFGFEGAPTTATLTVHSPVYTSMAAGASVIYDSYGPVNQTSFFVDYAYHLQMGSDIKLSLGLKAGINNYAVNYDGLSKTNHVDNAYVNANEQEVHPNFGFGLYLYSSKFYLGLSVPRIIENSFEEGSTSYGDGTEIRHYYGMTGVVFRMNDWLVVKPSIMCRLAQGSPLSVDANVNTVIYNKIWLGAMYRFNESFGGILQYQLTQQLKLGYAFDLNTNELSSYHSGTHEVMINYEFNFNKEKVSSPRYF